VAQGVCFPKDLVVKWHLSCDANIAEKKKYRKRCHEIMLSRYCQRGAFNYGGVFERVKGKEVEETAYFSTAVLFSHSSPPVPHK